MTLDNVLKIHGQLIDDIDGDPESADAKCISTCIDCGAVFERTDAIDIRGRDYEDYKLIEGGDGACR